MKLDLDIIKVLTVSASHIPEKTFEDLAIFGTTAPYGTSKKVGLPVYHTPPCDNGNNNAG